MMNGRYCKSGLAFPIDDYNANCSATDHIEYNNKKIDQPYICDATNQSSRCSLFYNYSLSNDAIKLPQRSFNVRCSCGLDGNNGFCSNILGTKDYEDAVAKLKTVLEASQCHTLDRDNFRAQRDSCGIGGGSDLDKAISAMFEVKYFPWVQTSRVKNCIEEVFDDSLRNQQKMEAAWVRGMMGTGVALALMMIMAYL